mmetsp:Transcript_43058/g.50497  ORF Transcript_43058/g.50497 Transcript_43058/m.50497 type:complete len:460 (-) Transcript_43058:107-1486(-)
MKRVFAMELRDNFWKNMEEQIVKAHERTKAIKFSYSPDNTLAYIDFLDLSIARDDYIGPELPLKFMWSGFGTYYYPYTININDPLLKSVARLFHDQRLQKEYSKFCENLNFLVNRISFFDFPHTAFRCISEMLEYIHKMNRSMFNVNRMKIYLYVTETKLQKDKEYDREYTKKFPLNIKILKNEFEAILKALIDDLRIKIIQKSHDIKFCMVFDNFEVKGDSPSKTHNNEDSELKSDNSNHSSVSSEEEGELNAQLQNRHTSDDDEEYSNIYREAKKAQHKKLNMKSTQNSFKDLEVTQEESKDIKVEHYDIPKKTEFYHFLAVPKLTSEGEGEDDDEGDSHEFESFPSLNKLRQPLSATRSMNTSLNIKRSYASIGKPVNESQMLFPNNINMTVKEEGSTEESNLNTSEMNRTLRAETIGETYFESANLKGCRKCYVIYMLLVSCLRFMCFRSKRPIK